MVDNSEHFPWPTAQVMSTNLSSGHILFEVTV